MLGVLWLVLFVEFYVGGFELFGLEDGWLCFGLDLV